MESVTIKIERSLADRMDKTMKARGYSTKTEFIREAIRKKLEEEEHERLVSEFMSLKGRSKIKTTDEENRKTREKLSEDIMQELKKRFS